MKLFAFALLGLIAIALWLLSIAEWRTIELPEKTRTLIVPPSLRLDDTDKPQEVWKELWEFQLSRYYSPTADQTESLAYEKNRNHTLMMNCWSTDVEDCKTAANDYILRPEDAGNVYSCPKEIAFDTKIKLVFHRGTVYWVCKDRWGKIVNKTLDSRCGYWNKWVRNIKSNIWCVTGKAMIYSLQW